MLGVGQPAPDFALRDQHGQTVTLADLAGTPALLVFFPFAFSGICSSELADLRDHRSTFDNAGARILGVSCDPMFALRVFSDRDDFGFPLLSDFWPHGAVATAYQCFSPEAGAATRSSFLVDAASTVRWTISHDAGERRDIDLHLEALAQIH
ncbi:MAG: peroxiredoxin [Aeromicrobium sp.]|uniref:peroxiredoxin n=1 Tax=Aeromicrobium sp. TaxID=1871063 RepID=UPI003C657FF3